MKELIANLKLLYPNVDFNEGHKDNTKILLYSDRNLMWGSKFEKTVVELAEKYLSPEEYNSFAYIYEKF